MTTRVEALASRFENFAAPIRRIVDELSLCELLPARDFRLTPLLFLGPPGVGKTAFATSLAAELNVPQIFIHGSEPGWVLAGASASWKNARVSLLAEHMGKSQSATPLVVVDEIDKPVSDYWPIHRPLLDLLEPDSARWAKDEFTQTEFNFRHVIWFLTANSLKNIPEPLLSRLDVCEIPVPGEPQRKRIIRETHKNLVEKTGKAVDLPDAEVSRLAARLNIDLRSVARIVQTGFIQAVKCGGAVFFELPGDTDSQPTKTILH